LDQDDSKSLRQELEKLKENRLDEFICKEDDSSKMPLLIKWCLEKSSVDCLHFLIQEGFKIDCTDKLDHNTPLHIAARKNDQRLVEFLVTHGAQIDSKNGNGQTAFDLTSDETIKLRLKFRLLDQVCPLMI
jgi:ankyrin repeat protein